MKDRAPFDMADLAELELCLLERAARVVSMAEIIDGDDDTGVIGLRHDVDNFIEPAVSLAAWEGDRGYRATYFVLHTAPYWTDKVLLRDSLAAISEQGHEIGFHLNAITQALETGGDPLDLLDEAVEELRSYGYAVRGVVAHGDAACYTHTFVNDEIFSESPRPDWGAPDRLIGGRVQLKPVSRAKFGFDYDPNWITRSDYLSDSGGRWSQPFDEVCERFPSLIGQLHILWHPDWWSQAFPQAVAA